MSSQQEIWNAFCDQLKEAGNVIMRDDLPTTQFDKAEGLRYMARLTKAGLDTFCELTGPKYPVLRTQADMVKMGLDNPDNYYVGASINAKYDYKITGNRGTIHFLGFAAQAQNFAARSKVTGGAGHLNHGDMEFDADGNFELIASQQPKFLSSFGRLHIPTSVISELQVESRLPISSWSAASAISDIVGFTQRSNALSEAMQREPPSRSSCPAGRCMRTRCSP